MTHSTSGAVQGDFEIDEKPGTETIDESFEQQVNDIAAKMVEKDGVWEIPEDLKVSKEVAYAAKLEKRRRDTQSAYAKTSQELEATKTSRDSLKSKLREVFKPQLTEDQQEELDDLKASDPEAYRQKMNEYEEQATSDFEKELADDGYDEEAISEMATRASQLEDFLIANPGLQITDEIVENDVPPRLVKQLEEGEVSFEDFLKKAKPYFPSGDKKVVINKGEEDEEEPDLNKAGGGDKASDAAIKKDVEKSYAEGKLIF